MTLCRMHPSQAKQNQDIPTNECGVKSATYENTVSAMKIENWLMDRIKRRTVPTCLGELAQALSLRGPKFVHPPLEVLEVTLYGVSFLHQEAVPLRVLFDVLRYLRSVTVCNPQSYGVKRSLYSDRRY